jgi:hypothetical protein
MFNLGKLFGAGKAPDQITSLKLEGPVSSHASLPAQAKTVAEQLQARKEMQAKFDQSPMAAVVQQRAKALLESGPWPEAMYYGTQPGTNVPVGFVSPDKTKGMVLIFSSPILAYQLFRTKALHHAGAAFEIREFKLDEMEETAQGWKSHGFNAFLFNLTPKKISPPSIDARGGVINKEMLLRAWAGNRVACTVLAEAWRLEFSATNAEDASFQERLKRQRAALENLRDMGAGHVPFVHWQIALIAGMQGDEEGRLAATASLEEFGPDFVGKTVNSADDLKSWGESMSLSMVGLMTEFGMLAGPDGKPMPSILKIRSEPIQET